MSASARLRATDYRAILTTVGECRDLGDDARRWRGHFFQRLAELTDADLVVGGELGGLLAGAPRDLGSFDWGWEHGFDRRGWARALELLRHDPTYSPVLGEYGRRLASNGPVALARSEM